MRGSTARRVSVLALTAILGTALLVDIGSAASVSALDNAVAAKKKCKKKKSSASAAKKKKCKKKKVVVPPTVAPPTTPSGPTSRQRVILTWTDNTVDLDLYAWDNSGNQAWYDGNDIPSSEIVAGEAFPETFTDTLPPFSRSFAIGVCIYDGDGTATDVPLDVDYVDSSNVTHHYDLLIPDSMPGSRLIRSHNYPTPGTGDPWFGEYEPESSSPGWCVHAD